MMVVYIHIQFLRNYWQIWTNKLKYWSLFGLVVQGVFILLFAMCISVAVYHKQGI